MPLATRRAWQRSSLPSDNVTTFTASSSFTDSTSTAVMSSAPSRVAWATARRARSPPLMPLGNPR